MQIPQVKHNVVAWGKIIWVSEYELTHFIVAVQQFGAALREVCLDTLISLFLCPDIMLTDFMELSPS
jgi:hypothetical protein